MKTAKDNSRLIRTLVNRAAYEENKFENENMEAVLTYAFEYSRAELDKFLDKAIDVNNIEMIDIYLDAIEVNHDFSLIKKTFHRSDINHLIRFTKKEIR